MRGRAEAARRAHNPEVIGSNPIPATFYLSFRVKDRLFLKMEDSEMAKKAMILKQQAPAKYSTRRYNRCKICGRPHAYLRNYGICRICFRELAYKGEIPGVRKASW